MPRAVRLSPLSIRLSGIERAALERRAGGMGLSTYVKSVLFGGDASRAPSRRRISADRVLLAQILGQLGASGLASGLRRLAAAADTGSLNIDDPTIQRLHDACDDVRGMHLLLMGALGKSLPADGSHQDRLSPQFARAADTEARQ